MLTSAALLLALTLGPIISEWKLSRALREVSGLAVTADGRLLAHGDETGTVHEIDPVRRSIVKSFVLRGTPRADFEGITASANDIYMVTSNGVLYRFREGAAGARVPYAKQDTRLGKECEFEGVAFERERGWLVLPCKITYRRKHRDKLVFYRWQIGQPRAEGVSEFTIPLARIVNTTGWKNFRPSDITIDPAKGNYVMISSLDRGLVEMTPGGRVLRAETLPARHRQPEGLAITRSGTLIIADEATRVPATITLYRWNVPGRAKRPP